MKKAICLLLALLLSATLTGCQSSPDTAGITIPFDAHYPMDQASWQDYLTTENVVYHRADDLLYFCPAGETEFIPLCGKPNCDHASSNCAAWLHGANGIGYHKGRLYAVVFSTGKNPDSNSFCTLVSMEPTGENRREELQIPSIRYSDGTSGCAAYFQFQESRLVCFLEANAEAPYEEQINRLLVIDLDTLSITEPFTELLSQHARVAMDARIAGDCLYAKTELPQNDGSIEYWAMELNMNSGAIRKLERFDNVYMWYADSSDLRYLLPGVGFMEYDLKTGVLQNRGLPVDELQVAKWFDDLICGIGIRSEDHEEVNIYFFDRAYELLDRIHLTNGFLPCYFGAERILFCSRNDPTPDTPTHYLDRSAIGSGKLELQPLGA